MVSHETSLTFEYDDARRASIVAASVREEVGEIAGDRTSARVEHQGATLGVRIEASDLVALRAGVNTWCSLVDVASEAAAIGASES